MVGRWRNESVATLLQNEGRRAVNYVSDWTTSHCGRTINPSSSPCQHICSVHTVPTDLCETSIVLNVLDYQYVEFLTAGCKLWAMFLIRANNEWINEKVPGISRVVCLWKHPGLSAASDGLLRSAISFVLIFYFYPLDMIPIVSRQAQRLNGLVKPPWRTALCSRLGGGGCCLSVSQTLALFSLSFPLQWLIFLVDGLICRSARRGQGS